MAGRQWEGSTFGNGWMHRNLVRLLRMVGPRPVYAFSSLFIVPWCVLFNRSGRSAYAFFHTRLGFPSLKSCWLTYRNHCLFSQVVIDRFAMYAGKSFEVEYEGDAFFKALEAKEEGFVMLSSHIGNYEIAGYSLVSARKGIHAVVYSSEKESVMRNRSGMFGKTNVSMIAMQEDMSHLFEIDRAWSAAISSVFPRTGTWRAPAASGPLFWERRRPSRRAPSAWRPCAEWMCSP